MEWTRSLWAGELNGCNNMRDVKRKTHVHVVLHEKQNHER